jgi:hypothetical protein
MRAEIEFLPRGKRRDSIYSKKIFEVQVKYDWSRVEYRWSRSGVEWSISGIGSE